MNWPLIHNGICCIAKQWSSGQSRELPEMDQEDGAQKDERTWERARGQLAGVWLSTQDVSQPRPVTPWDVMI